MLKVAFARAGATLVDAYSEERPRPMKKLKPSKIRGVESAGMVCSERELGLSEEHEGIIVLPEDAPVGTPLRDYLGDVVFELDLTPDMARDLNLIGVAREVSALTDAPLHLPPDVVHAAGEEEAADYVAVRIDEPELCNRYTGILIRDVVIGPSPKWLQERLLRAGMRPISNVVDITNYVMLEYGQPLHAFDYDVLLRRAQEVGDAKPTIIVRRAAAGEKFITLDDVERTLDTSMLMIADTLGSVAIAGVMGGQESEISPTTRHILLEAATFEGINNRRTSQKLKLFSEASFRFARGVPATLNDIAARRAAELMRLYAGGRVVPGMVDAYPVPQVQPVVYTTASDIQRLLGMSLTLTDIASALRRLDFHVKLVTQPAGNAPAEAAFGLHRNPDEPLLECTPPWYRLDIHMPADLTEEVARVVGYEQVGTTLMQDALPTQHRHEVVETEEKIRDILLGAGLQDTVNYALSSPENHARLTPGRAVGEVPFIELANPGVVERRVMRRSLLVSVLENVQYNLRHGDRLAMFELGRVYLPELGDGVLPLEERRLSITLVGSAPAAGLLQHGGDEPGDGLLRPEGDRGDAAGAPGLQAGADRVPCRSRTRAPSARAAPPCGPMGSKWGWSAKSIRRCGRRSTCPACAWWRRSCASPRSSARTSSSTPWRPSARTRRWWRIWPSSWRRRCRCARWRMRSRRPGASSWPTWSSSTCIAASRWRRTRSRWPSG